MGRFDADVKFTKHTLQCLEKKLQTPLINNRKEVGLTVNTGD